MNREKTKTKVFEIMEMKKHLTNEEIALSLDIMDATIEECEKEYEEKIIKLKQALTKQILETSEALKQIRKETAKEIFEEIEKMPISTEGIIFYVDEDEDWEKFKQKWLGEDKT